MLACILDYFEKSKETRSLKDLARILKIEPSALEGMLDYLVKKKKLKVEYQDKGCQKRGPACIACPLKSKGRTPSVKYYQLAD